VIPREKGKITRNNQQKEEENISFSNINNGHRQRFIPPQNYFLYQI